MRIISLDFETFYHTKEKYDIRNLGAVPYIRHERFDPYLISVSDGSQSWAGHPRNFNWNALDDQTLLSHNAGFDSRVLEEMTKRNLAPKVNFKEWHCTANLSTFLCMRRDLARAAEFLLGVAVDKSYRLDADGKTWDDMVKAGVDEKVKEAGRVDALRCWQIWAKFGHLWPERERRLSNLTIRQCQRGCRIDFALLSHQLNVVQQAIIQAETNLPWMKYGKVPTSTKAIAEECRKVGIPCPPVKAHEGEEAYEQWAAAYSRKYEWVRAFSSYRVLNKYLGKLEKIRSRLNDEGRCTYDLFYFGAHTGRWQSGGGLAMQTLRKEPIYIDCDGWLVTEPDRLKEISNSKTKLEWVAHVLDERALWVATPGRKMMAPDLSQIEPRVLAWLVKDREMLDLMARGYSPYQSHAETKMNWTRGDLKALIENGDAEARTFYKLVKAQVLGLGFGCGWEKFITVARDMAQLDITKDDPAEIEARNEAGEICLDQAGKPIMLSGVGMTSKKVVKDYREQNPLICSKDTNCPGIWKKLDDAFRASVGGDFEMMLPSGRSLRYPEVKREWKRIPDEDRPGKWKTESAYTAWVFDVKTNGFRRKKLYGGLLTENIVQATARDVFGEGLLNLDSMGGVDVLFSVHDEAVIEADMDVKESDVLEAMTKCPDWIPGLPLAAEGGVIPHYKK